MLAMPRDNKQAVTALQQWPSEYYRALAPKDYHDTLNSVTPTLAGFRRDTSERHVLAIMTLLVNDLIDFFVVKNTMNENQLAQTINLLIEDFYYLNIEDFKLCFNNAKKGRYGKIYDRIDGMIIYEWVRMYAEERVKAAEERDDRYKVDDRHERQSERVDDVDKAMKINMIMKKYAKKT